MAYAGIRKNFEAAGFSLAAETTSVLTGFPRVLMRLRPGLTPAHASDTG